MDWFLYDNDLRHVRVLPFQPSVDTTNHSGFMRLKAGGLQVY